MIISGKVYCLFEQSGTFKNEFLKLGIKAEDYDIKNEYGETDHEIDIFYEIDNYYLRNANIFTMIDPEDLILAFFPCIYFSEKNEMTFTGVNKNQRNLNKISLLDSIIVRAEKRHKYYIYLMKLIQIAQINQLRLIIENPYSTQGYLYRNFPYKPSLIDKNRRLRGDWYRKPTQYWFINCEPEYLFTYEKPIATKVIEQVNGNNYGGMCNKERSEISPTYARNFILDNILGIPRKETQMNLEILLENTT